MKPPTLTVHECPVCHNLWHAHPEAVVTCNHANTLRHAAPVAVCKITPPLPLEKP